MPPGKRLILGCEIPEKKNIIVEEYYYLEENENLLKDYTEDLNPTEKLDMAYILRHLKCTEDLDSIMSRLEKLEIVGEDPTKYWELDQTYYKLEIINPNLTIKTQELKYTN